MAHRTHNRDSRAAALSVVVLYLGTGWLALAPAACAPRESNEPQPGPTVSNDCPGFDRNFDEDGFAVYGPAHAQPHAEASGVAVDGAGRVLAAGFVSLPSGGYRMTIWAYRDDGTLDQGFGAGGMAISPATTDSDYGYDIVVDGAGRLVVAGAVWGWTDRLDMVTWRFLPGGNVDASFGTNGRVRRNDATGPGLSDTGNAVVTDSAGRVLVAGTIDGSNGDPDAVVWAMHENGAPDLSFGRGGISVQHDLAGGAGTDQAHDLVLDAAENLVVVGTSAQAEFDWDAVAFRLTPSGTLDPSFGTGGVAAIDAPKPRPHQLAYAVAIDGAGRIVVKGMSQPGALYDMTIWRLSPDGALDPTFAGVGYLTHQVTGGGGGVGIDSQGRICVAGRTSTLFGESAMAIWRFDDAGRLDRSFGCDGIFLHARPEPEADRAAAAAIAFDSLGRIVAAGSTRNRRQESHAVVWRVWP